MIKLKIEDKDRYQYKLKDEEDREYKMELDFWDVEKKPEIGDYIYMNEELLNSKYEGYSTSYTFGCLENKYGKEEVLLDDIDLIKIVSDKTEIYLKRLYG